MVSLSLPPQNYRKARAMLVVDNGGFTVKAGLATDTAPRWTMPNCAARVKNQLRVLVGDETETQIKGATRRLSSLCATHRRLGPPWLCSIVSVSLRAWRQCVRRSLSPVLPVVLLCLPSAMCAALSSQTAPNCAICDPSTAAML